MSQDRSDTIPCPPPSFDQDEVYTTEEELAHRLLELAEIEDEDTYL